MARVRSEQAWARSKRWTEELAREVLSALAASGQTLADFAELEGLNVKRLERWQRRLASGQDFEQPAFVELTPMPSSRSEGSGALMFEVVVASGRLVRVPAEFDAYALRRLLSVLEDARC